MLHHIKKYSPLKFLSLSLLFISLLGVVVLMLRVSSTKNSNSLFVNRGIAAETSPTPSPNYAPGKIIVKFNPTVSYLSTSTSTTALDSKSVSFTSIANPPASLVALNKQFAISTVEKIFKGNYGPTAELTRIKTRFAQEISSGTRKINESLLSSIDLSRIYLLTIPQNAKITSAIDILKANTTEVAYAEPNFIAQATFVPNDTYFNCQWSLHNVGPNVNTCQTGGTADSDIDAPEAWNIYAGSPNTIVAVIDSGIDLQHSDLKDNIWRNVKEVPNDGIDNDSNGYIDDFYGYNFNSYDDGFWDNDPTDDHGHGTHVAGIVASRSHNGKGIAGVCPNCKVMAVKVINKSGHLLFSDAVTAVYYAGNNGARVLNNSWGCNWYFFNGCDSTAMKDAIVWARGIGVLFVAAAGNAHNDLAQVPFYPAGYRYALAVAALDFKDQASSYTNYGTRIDISSPGGAVDDTATTCSSTNCRYPKEKAILSTMSSGSTWNCWGNQCGITESGFRYMGGSGTSMASPHVAGAAGLLLSLSPNLTVDALVSKLKSSADPIDSKNAGYVGKLGSGRLNIYKMLQGVIPPIPTPPPSNYSDSPRVFGTVVVNDTYLTCSGQTTAKLAVSLNNTSPQLLTCVNNRPLFYFQNFTNTTGFKTSNYQLFYYQTPYPNYTVSWTCTSIDRITKQAYSDQCLFAYGTGDKVYFNISNFRSTADIYLNYFLESPKSNFTIPTRTPIPTNTPTPTLVPSYCKFVAVWGSVGSTDNRFHHPHGITTDSNGNVYVVDTSNHRIQKFSSTGAFLGKWGSFGSENGQFLSPYGIATDTAGNIYVADTGNDRVQKFSSTGTFLGTWGSFGSGNGQFNTPFGIATDKGGNVYVADTENDRVQKFSSTGAFLGTWGSYGSEDGNFIWPFSITTDGGGYVYVADTYNHRVQKFSSTGTFLGTWGSSGSANGQFLYPHGITTDTAGNVYVADTNNDRIQKFLCPQISQPTPTPYSLSSTTSNIIKEAETGTRTTYMKKATDTSGVTYIYTDTISNPATATYSLSVPTPGDYYVWMRGYAANGSSDSFYISFNGGQTKYRAALSTTYNSWQWKKLYLVNETIPTPTPNSYGKIYLSAGTHQLVISRREPNARLDKFILTTSSSFIP